MSLERILGVSVAIHSLLALAGLWIWKRKSSALSGRNQALEITLEKERAFFQQQLSEQKRFHEELMQQQKASFQVISSEALREAFPSFLQLAQQTLGSFHESARGEFETKKEQINGLLKPLEEQLKNYQFRLQQSESQQAQMVGELRQQLQGLSQQSQSLAQ